MAYSGSQNDSKITSWIQLHNSNTNFKNKKIYLDSTWFTVTRDEGFESEKDFKNRAKYFGSFCKNLYNNSRIDLLKPIIEKISNYYVPIDSTELYKHIPERDKILYSTRCRVKNIQGRGKHKVTKRWTPHVLITRTGLALFHKKRNKPIFNSWYHVPKVIIKEPHRIKINSLPGVWKHSRTFFSIEKKALDNKTGLQVSQ